MAIAECIQNYFQILHRIDAIFACFFCISRININLILGIKLNSMVSNNLTFSLHLIKGLFYKNGCEVKW